MRRGTSVAWVVLSAACGAGQPAPAQEAKQVEAGPAKVEPVASPAEARAEAKAPVPVDVTALRDAGRKAAKVKDWDAARKAFTEAMSRRPDDSSLQAELGWIEFNAGDLARARALTEAALLKRPEGKSRAAQLYNFGRILEASGERDNAIKAYEASLAERPSKAVREQLEALRAAAPPATPTPAPPSPVLAPPGPPKLPCDTWQTEAALCACLERHIKELIQQPEAACRIEAIPGLDGVGITSAKVSDDLADNVFLVERGPQGLAVILDAGLDGFQKESVKWLGATRFALADGAELLRVDIERTSGGSEWEGCMVHYDYTFGEAWMCVREKGATAPVKCGLKAPLLDVDQVTVACDDEENGDKLAVKTTREVMRFSVDVGTDGIVKVERTEGDPEWAKDTWLEPWLAVKTVPVRGPEPH